MSEVTLSPEQQKIVDLDSGQHLVLAPPGTGKTELLVNRLEKAIKNFPQDEIACLTFTNRAAKNMVERIEESIKENQVFIGNIHSYCSKFLRKNNLIPQITSMLDEGDTDLLFEEILKDRGSSLKPADLSKLNSLLNQKSMGFEPQICQANPYHDAWKIAEGEIICMHYEEIKKESNLMDFDDLLNLTYDYFNKNANFKPIIKWLQVDEAQDLNPLQWAIIDKISSKELSHRLFFGDREQAIFSFMGASIENLQQIESNSQMHNLDRNYRSPQYLLNLYNLYANNVLGVSWLHDPVADKNTPYRTGDLKMVFTKQSPQGEVVALDLLPKMISGFTSKKLDSLANEELIKLALNKQIIKDLINLDNHVNSQKIKESIRSKLIDNSAILVRRNDDTNFFFEALEYHQPELKVFVISKFDLFKRRIVKDLMSVLSVIIKDRDKVAWTRNLSIFGGISLKASRPLIDIIFRSGINPLDFIESSDYEMDYLDGFLELYNHERIVVIDTETTGLNKNGRDDVIEIAAIEIIAGKIGRTFEVNIDTDRDFAEAEKIHHISKEYLQEHAIDRTLALSNFVEFVGDDAIIAHNLDFDFTILNQNLQRVGIPILSKRIKTYDSVEITKRLFPTLARYKLDYLIKRFDLEGVNSHRAIDDVKATISLITRCIREITETQASRSNWKNNPETVRIIQKFKDRFSVLYNALKSDFNKEVRMSDITHSITSYINDHVEKNRYDTKDFIELDKLKLHMDKTFTLEKSILSIQNHIPHLTKSKESDLIVKGETDVVISTIHKAKGLEWNNVIIPSCIKNIFPHFYSRTASAQLEDARLLYVAMTRAKKRLALLVPSINANGYPERPSPFLTEEIRDMFEVQK